MRRVIDESIVIWIVIWIEDYIVIQIVIHIDSCRRH
jgi:hypothetical protein